MSLLQVYASPLSAVTTKLIQNPKLTVYESFRTVLYKEADQLPQRIGSRMVLAASRNAIAITISDQLYGWLKQKYP